MAQVSFGTILRNERERQGYDLSSVARRLHIRPDILRAIEASNFDLMPPRGYARNMIHAYARFLGLNPTEVTRIYLDEAYAYQVKCARTSVTFNNLEKPTPSAQDPTSRKVSPPRQENTIERRTYAKESPTPGRTLYVDDRNSRYRNNEKERLYPGEQGRRSMHPAVPSTQYTNFYAGPRAPGGILSKLPIIIACAIILILIAVLFVFFFNNRNDTGTLPNVPVTGVTEGEGEGTSTTPTPPTKVVFKFELAEPDDMDAWVEIYLNGEQQATVANLVSELETKSYDVTGTLRFETANPAGVNVYIDDVKQELTNDDGDGYWSITVDFNAILARWLVEHPSPKPATDTGSSDAASNGSGDTATGSNGSGSTTASGS